MRRLLLLLAVVVSGCGNDVSPDKACTDAATALCNKLNACAAPLITVQYGDVATCQARAKIACTPTFMAPSTAATPNKLDDCAKSLDGLTCAQLFTHQTTTACLPAAGKLADGAACGDDPQCTNSYCKKPAGQVCGVCSKRASAGASCTVEADCDYGLTCAGSVCVSFGMAGAPCDAGHPCGLPNVCRNGTCAMPAGAGQSCTPSTGGGDCDQTAGLYCDPIKNTCVMAAYAGAGQPCGYVNGTYTLCSGAGHCKLSGVTGTCVGPAADGAACDSTNGPTCTSPAECVNGACKLPNPASCT